MRCSSIPAVVVAFSVACTSASAAAVRRSHSIQATVKNGTYSGLSLPTFDQEIFLGVPYAQPPVGDLRLRQSVALNASFAGVKALTERVPQCEGIRVNDPTLAVSEDCLYMNILRPAGTTKDDDLPVALWIHGGAFEDGGINWDYYNASYFVQESVAMGKPVVQVAIAYRLSVFGFLNSPELAADGLQNIGLHDQRRALRWVQENIKAFGGDPDKVTIWGESAGAMSVAAQLIAYGDTTTDLFRGAIMQSGSPTTNTFSDLNATQPKFDQLLANVSCTDAADAVQCLREVPIDVLNKTTKLYDWFPAIDGSLLPESPTKQLAAGKFVHLPIIAGTVTDEGTFFGTKGIDTDDDLKDALRASYPNIKNATVDKFLSLYPDDATLGSPYGTGDGYLPTGRQDKRSNSLYGDLVMIGPKRLMVESMVKKESDVWAFRFDQVPTYLWQTYGALDLGITHGKDNAYIFGHPENNRTGDAELMRFMMRAWIAFANDLDPNKHGLKDEPEWPKYSANATNMVLKRQGRWLEPDTFRKEGIAFINSIGPEINK